MNNDQSKGNVRETNGKGKQAAGKSKADNSQDIRGKDKSEQHFGKSQVRAGNAKRDSDKSKNVNAQSSGRN